MCRTRVHGELTKAERPFLISSFIKACNGGVPSAAASFDCASAMVMSDWMRKHVILKGQAPFAVCLLHSLNTGWTIKQTNKQNLILKIILLILLFLNAYIIANCYIYLKKKSGNISQQNKILFKNGLMSRGNYSKARTHAETACFTKRYSSEL